MVSVNKIIIIGNLGGDPEMRFTPNGHAVTTFNVATNRVFTVGGERREETEWFRVTVWNKQAETCNQYLTKGQQVYVEGRVKLDTWDGPDGQPRSRMEINADQVRFLSRPGGGAPAGESQSPDVDQGDFSPDDIPF